MLNFWVSTNDTEVTKLHHRQRLFPPKTSSNLTSRFQWNEIRLPVWRNGGITALSQSSEEDNIYGDTEGKEGVVKFIARIYTSAFNPTARRRFRQPFKSECKQARAPRRMETLSGWEVQKIIMRGLCVIRVNAFFYSQLEVENHTLVHGSFCIKKKKKKAEQRNCYRPGISESSVQCCLGLSGSARTYFSQFLNHKLINKPIRSSNKRVRARGKQLCCRGSQGHGV